MMDEITNLARAMEKLAQFKTPVAFPKTPRYLDLFDIKIDPYRERPDDTLRLLQFAWEAQERYERRRVCTDPVIPCVKILKPDKIVGGYFECGAWKEMRFKDLFLRLFRNESLPKTYSGINNFCVLNEEPELTVFPGADNAR